MAHHRLPVNPWESLGAAHDRLRDCDARELARRLRPRLDRLAEDGHCSKTIRGRLTTRANFRRLEMEIAGADNGEPLLRVPELASARLSLWAASVQHRLMKLDFRIDGVRPDGSTLVVAVHLDEAPMGAGASTHALLHCHVGPDLAVTPKVRVPFPPLAPEVALDWLLGVVVPHRESAPWPGT